MLTLPLTSVQVPIVSTAVAPNAPRGLNRLAWDKRDGRKAAIGSSDGRVYVYELQAGKLCSCFVLTGWKRNFMLTSFALRRPGHAARRRVGADAADVQ